MKMNAQDGGELGVRRHGRMVSGWSPDGRRDGEQSAGGDRHQATSPGFYLWLLCES